MTQKIYAQNIHDAMLAFHEVVLNDKGKVIDLAADYRNCYFGKLEENSLKQVETDSPYYTTKYRLSGYSNVVLDSFFNPDSVNRQDLGEEGKLFTHWQKTNFVVDRREAGWGKSTTPSQIYNYLELQFTNMMQSFYDQNERLLWTVPTSPNDGSTANVAPWSINSWIVQSATADAGFNGLHPTDYSAQPDSLNRTTYPQLRNGTAVSQGVTYGDFAKKASKLIDLCQWKPPKPMKTSQEMGYQFEMVSGYAPFSQYQDLVRSGNDNIGVDAGKYFGDARIPYGSQVFRGIIWTWSDALTSSTLADGTSNPAYDSNEPVYLFNWKTWRLMTQSGWWMHMDPPERLENPHNTVVQHMDTTYNLWCMNPRSNAVIRTA